MQTFISTQVLYTIMIFKCLVCGKGFNDRPSRKRKTCSRQCFYEYSRTERIVVKCNNCGKSISRVPSDLRSKNNLYFCDRKCKEFAQSISGGNIEALQPKGYNGGTTKYREWAFDKYGYECSECGLLEEHLLVVHHKDGNRNNNELNNLKVVCHNCHAKLHLTRVNDKLIYSPKHLTINVG